MRRQVILNWQASNSFGWGLLGLNIFQQWARDPEIQPLMGVPIEPKDLQGIDPLRLLAMESATVAANEFLVEFAAGNVDLRERQALVIDGLENGLHPPSVHRGGVRNVARCIFEDTRVDNLDQKLAGYDSLVCASDWSARLLRAGGSKPVTMIHEGIDPSHFFPGPRSGLLDSGRFYVFSGGKVEFRKAQDLVLLAFREFAARHDEAVLVAAWHSPWPQISAGYQGRLPVPLRLNSDGGLDIRRWAVENGIAPKQFIELPLMQNTQMPAILREMDCAVQVSRCEACTNLPATEAMACGVPVILADNTGVRDLIDADNCVALQHQTPIELTSGIGTAGWGDSSVEEIVAALEMLYTDTQSRRRIGARGAEWIIERRRTWRNHASELKTHLFSLL
jgi:glycosyltransferase involved in cell wall biosynthesis